MTKLSKEITEKLGGVIEAWAEETLIGKPDIWCMKDSRS